MKIGMNLLLWTAHVTPADAPLLNSLKKTGFDGVEIPLFQGDAAHYRAVRKVLDDAGLQCTTVTVMSADKNPVSPDSNIRQAALDHLRWALDMSAALGADALAGPVHSALGVFSGNAPTADERRRSADVLRDAGRHAASAKTTIAIEYLNRFESYVLTTAADARNLVDAINLPNVGMMWDSFHGHIEEKNSAAEIRASAKQIVHVHISEADRGVPGTGQVHWDETFDALRAINYDRWMTIEAFGRALPDLAAATRVWRDLFASPDDVTTGGLAFIRKQLARR